MTPKSQFHNATYHQLEKYKNLVFFWIVCLHFRAISCWKPHQNWTNGSKVIAISEMLKTITYKGNWMLLLALSKNQYERVPTHFAWSRHICHNERYFMSIFKNYEIFAIYEREYLREYGNKLYKDTKLQKLNYYDWKYEDKIVSI